MVPGFGQIYIDGHSSYNPIQGNGRDKILWTTFAAFSVCVLFGYLLLRQSDMDQEQANNSAVTKVPSEPNKE